MTKRVEDLAKACLILASQAEKLSKQVLALSNLNAILIREMALSKAEPLEYLALIEAEVGGLGEAIAISTRGITDVSVSSREITDVFEAVLRQARQSLEAKGFD
jgi:hypothetical protein